MNENLLSDRLLAAKKAKELRDNSRVTWKAIADACGVSNAAVSRWKSGLNGIDAQYARLLADYLGVSAVWLETGEGGMAEGVTQKIDDETQFVMQRMTASDHEGRILAKNAVIEALSKYQRREAEENQYKNGSGATKPKTA